MSVLCRHIPALLSAGARIVPAVIFKKDRLFRSRLHLHPSICDARPRLEPFFFFFLVRASGGGLGARLTGDSQVRKIYKNRSWCFVGEFFISSSFLTLRVTFATLASQTRYFALPPFSTCLTMIASAELNMILRDLSAFNMGRGAYDTTGVKKPGAPPPPPK